MAYKLKERPHIHSFSLNPIRYVVDVTNPDTPGCAVEFELYSFPITEPAVSDLSSSLFNGTLITKQALYPARNGRVEFYIEDFLNSQLDWDMPEFFLFNTAGWITSSTNQLKRYGIRYRQVSKGNLSPVWASDLDHLRIVLKGGIAKEKFDRNNYFINHLYPKKTFLTWQPADEQLGLQERKCLTYFHHSDIDATQLRAKFRIVYVDGSSFEDYKAFPLTPKTLLFHIPCSISDLFNLNNKPVWFFEVSVIGPQPNDEVFAEPFRMFVDYTKRYNEFSFFYFNSLGGIDSVRILGEKEVDLIRDYTEIEQATGGDFSGGILPTEMGAINISAYKVYKGDVGYLNSQRMQEALEDLLHSQNIFQVIGGKGLRVINLQKTQSLGSSEDTRWNFPLQWRYTYNNSQFTPGNVLFGQGSTEDPEEPLYGFCESPINLSVSKGAQAGGAIPVTLSWDAVLGAEGYQLQYQKEGASEWTTVSTEEPSFLLNLTSEGEYRWQLRTKCSADDFSHYAFGPGFSITLTGPACQPHSNLAVSLISLDGNNGNVTFTWTGAPGTVGFVLEWRPVGSANWNSISSQMNLSISVPKDVQYEWRLRSKCDNLGNFSPWFNGPNFIPSNMSGTCNAPQNLQGSSRKWIMMHQLDFSWNAAPGAGSYQLQFRDMRTPGTWNTTNVNGTTFNTPWFNDREIEWKVRSVCTGGGYSAFSQGPNIYT